MALPQESQEANGLSKVSKVPEGKKMIFIDPDTNEGGIISVEDLEKQILDNLTKKNFSLEQGEMTLIQALNQSKNRMDNFASLPDGSTSGDAELADIRVGADGTQYPNAGDAVREQIKNVKQGAKAEADSLKEDFDGCVECISKIEEDTKTETQVDFVTVGKQLSDIGTEVDNSNRNVSDYIDLHDVYGIYRTGTTALFTMWNYAFYDEDKKFLKLQIDKTNYEIVDYAGKKVTWLNLYPKARYVKIEWDNSRTMYKYYVVHTKKDVKSYDVPYMTFNGEDLLSEINKIADANNILDEISEKKHSNNLINPQFFETGYYLDFNDGITRVNSNKAVISTNFIDIENATSLYLRQVFDNTSTSTLVLYFYDINRQYLSYRATRYEWIKDGTKDMNVPEKAKHIKVYLGGGCQPEKFCLSTKELNSFEGYKLISFIKKEAIQEDGSKISHPLCGKTIVNFGDSIFGNKRPPNDVSTKLAEITGATVHNCGFGGCRMSNHSNGWDAFSMYRIADSIANNDFSVQDNVDIPSINGMPSYFTITRDLLKSIDFNTVDIISIAYGTNDFTASKALDNAENQKDTTSFGGALRYSIETLLSAYSNLKIFICGQTYRFWMNSDGNFEEDSDSRTNSNGVKLTDFVEKTKEIAKEYHVKFIDNYYDLGINKYNRSHWFPSTDGTHHNPLGGKLMAEHMANEIF